MTQNHLWIQCNPYQNSNGILHRSRRNNLKISMDPQIASNSQSNPERKEQSRSNHTSRFQTILQNYINLNNIVLA